MLAEGGRGAEQRAEVMEDQGVLMESTEGEAEERRVVNPEVAS